MYKTSVEVAITIDDVYAAQAGDGRATELVLSAMAARIRTLAGTEARRLRFGDLRDLEDEFTQAANIACWEALARFEGDSVDTFLGFLFRTASTTITTRSNELRHPGADHDAIQVFGYWLRQTDGDLAVAEKLCQRSVDPLGRRLGRDRANAARLAWVSTASLDAPAPFKDWGQDGVTYADMLVSDLGIPGEFVTSDDLSHEQRSVRIELVRAVLESMGEISGKVLMLTYGIEPYGEFGVSANDEIGAIVGKTAKQVTDARTKGNKQFATKFIPLVSEGDEDAAAAWWAAFNAKRGEANANRTRAKSA